MSVLKEIEELKQEKKRLTQKKKELEKSMYDDFIAGKDDGGIMDERVNKIEGYKTLIKELNTKIRYSKRYSL